MLALVFEELGPGVDVGVLLEQCTALTFGHSAPHTELDTIVESICSALHEDRAVTADGGCLALCGATNKELVGIDLAASRLSYPGNSCLGLLDVQTATRGGCVHSGSPLQSLTVAMRRAAHHLSRLAIARES